MRILLVPAETIIQYNVLGLRTMQRCIRAMKLHERFSYDYIVVSGGLQGGDKVSLRDPTQKARDGSPQQKSGQGMKL